MPGSPPSRVRAKSRAPKAGATCQYGGSGPRATRSGARPAVPAMAAPPRTSREARQAATRTY
jgi:hypothetical protein